MRWALCCTPLVLGHVVGLHPQVELCDMGSAVQGWQERWHMDVVCIYIQTAAQCCGFSVFRGVRDRTWEQSKIRDLPALLEEKGKHSREVESGGSAGNKARSSFPVNLHLHLRKCSACLVWHWWDALGLLLNADQQLCRPGTSVFSWVRSCPEGSLHLPGSHGNFTGVMSVDLLPRSICWLGSFAKLISVLTRLNGTGTCKWNSHISPHGTVKKL